MAKSIDLVGEPEKVTIWRLWGPVVLALIVSFLVSTDSLSAENTRDAVARLTDWLGIARGHSGTFHLILRKTVHFCGYAGLGALLTWTLRRSGRSSPWRAAPLGCLAWAALDELHQSFTRQRQGTVLDVVLDSAGALTGWLLYGWMVSRVKHPLKISDLQVLSDAS